MTAARSQTSDIRKAGRKAMSKKIILLALCSLLLCSLLPYPGAANETPADRKPTWFLPFR